METCPSFVFPAPVPCLETFLVEWKPEEEKVQFDEADGLETFLVEWKRSRIRSGDPGHFPLETFLVEWKLPPRGGYRGGISSLKPS